MIARTRAPSRVPPFIGRERERMVLRDALDGAFGSEGGIVLLSGEAGIGKTRLADAFAREARQRGAGVHWGRAWEAAGAPAFWPWIQVIRGWMRDGEAATVAAAVRAAPDIATLLPELAPDNGLGPTSSGDDPDAGRFRLFDAIATFLQSAAVQRPLVLVLDDLHAADQSSLVLLAFMASAVSASALLIVGTIREDALAPDDPRTRSLLDVARAPSTIHLALSGFGTGEVADYLADAAGRVESEALANEIHRRTGGNPLFVAELVRLLVAEGRLRDGAGSDDRSAIPATVRTVISARLGRLSRRCAGLLGRAAVLGTEFPLDVLALIEPEPTDELLALLDEAVDIRAVIAPGSPGGRWRFAHGLVRDVLYAGLSAPERVRLHRAAGEALEALHPLEADRPFPELAYHFIRAAGTGSDARKAVLYARLAAERAEATYAHEEAARLYRLALETGGLTDLDRCRLLLELGNAASLAGDQAAMRTAYVDAAAIAGALGFAEEFGRAAIGYGGRLVHRRAGDDDALIPLLERALAMLPPLDSPLRARLLARLSGALRDQPNAGPREALSAEAVSMARRIGDPTTLGYALQARFAAIWGPDSLPEMRDLLDEIESVAAAAGDRDRLAETHWHRLVLLANTPTDAETIRRETETGAARARELRQPALEWYHVQVQVVTALNEGRLADVETLLPQLLQRGNGPVPWDADYAYRVALFLLRREQSRLDETVDLVRGAVAAFPGYRLLSCVETYVAAATGSRDAARRRLVELATDGYAFLPRDLGWLFGMLYLGEAAIVLEDLARAREIAVALDPYRELFATASGVLPGGPVARVIGLLHAALGASEEAGRYLEMAEAAARKAGGRLWELKARVERGVVLAGNGTPDDRRLARDLLEPALETSAALGLTSIEREARDGLQLLNSAGTIPARRAGPATRGMFVREGDTWAIEFGRSFRLRDAKGLRYLATLLGSPGREFHALELAAALPGGSDGSPHRGIAGANGELRMAIGGAEPLIDAEARAAYRARLLELRDERDEAEAWNDPERAARARSEIEALEAELGRAFGLGGRSRTIVSPAERARQSVSKAIRESLQRISVADAALGEHLERSIRTGTFCAYDPDPGARPHWRL